MILSVIKRVVVIMVNAPRFFSIFWCYRSLAYLLTYTVYRREWPWLCLATESPQRV